MGFFDQPEENEFDTSVQNEVLEKALEAGYGTDAAKFTGGRALQREDLEATLVSVLDVKQKDLKLFHKLHKQNETSTVHQLDRMVGVGDDEFLFVGEGEEAKEADGEIERRIFQTKYISTEWKVTHPATLTNNVESAINVQKIAGTTRVGKAVERGIFHGDSTVVPKQFDGLLKTLTDSSKNADLAKEHRAVLFDARGLEIGEKNDALSVKFNEDTFNEIAEEVFNRGGDLSEAYFPPALAGQFWNLFSDRLRYSTGDTHTGLEKLPDICTGIGSTIKITDDCGADKMFKVKGEVVAKGNGEKRPNTPTGLTAVASADSASKFNGFAGDYLYAVHAVNSFGISAGKEIAAAVTVAAGSKVTLTITPDSNGPRPSGFIITRSAAGGSKLMEMVRIKASPDGTTTYIDLNEELPGTGSIVLLTPVTDEMIPNLSFAQLMGLSNFDLPTNNQLTHRGVIAVYGNAELRAPEHCALIKNIGCRGGLY